MAIYLYCLKLVLYIVSPISISFTKYVFFHIPSFISSYSVRNYCFSSHLAMPLPTNIQHCLVHLLYSHLFFKKQYKCCNSGKYSLVATNESPDNFSSHNPCKTLIFNSPFFRHYNHSSIYFSVDL